MGKQTSIAPLVLASGEKLVTYEQAARLLGTSKATLKSHWIKTRWLQPTPYRQGRRRFVLLEQVHRAARERLRVASAQLFTVQEAARYVGVSARRLQRLVANGRLREARAGLGLFAREDLDRALLLLRGVRDPIRGADAARLAGVTKSTLAYWIEAGRVEAVQVGRYWYVSRAALVAVARKRKREAQMLQRAVAARRLLRTPDAARRLGVSELTLFKAFKRGILAPVHFELLRRTFVRAGDIERVRRRRLLKGPRRTGLPGGVLDVASTAKMLGTGRRRVRDLVDAGKLRVTARGNHGARAAFGFAQADVLALKTEREQWAKLVTTRGACLILGISPDDLRVLVHAGVVPIAARDPNRFYFDASALRNARDMQEVLRRRQRMAQGLWRIRSRNQAAIRER
jgi:excisionase family DNA binding protein